MTTTITPGKLERRPRSRWYVEKYLWEPAGEVVHDDGGDEGLAQAGGQAHEGVGQQRRLDHVLLVPALRDSLWVDPVPSVVPAMRQVPPMGALAADINTGTLHLKPGEGCRKRCNIRQSLKASR